MYPDFQNEIPDKSEMSISKLAKGGLLTSDTCNTARKIRLLLCEKIEEAAREKGLPEDEINMLEGDCWNHLRNVWLGGMIKCLNKYLNTALQDELEAINSRLRVSTSMDYVLRAIEKYFSHCANYAKGHEDQFYHWMGHNHPGAQLWPVERSSGSRQDLACSGAGPLYSNREYYAEFIDDFFHKSGNIFQENLFIILS